MIKKVLEKMNDIPPLYCAIKAKIATLFLAAALCAAARPEGLNIVNLIHHLIEAFQMLEHFQLQQP